MLEKTKYRILFLVALFGSFLHADARKLLVEARDSVSGEPVPYVAVYVKGTQQGVLAGENGQATLFLNSPDALLEFSAMGYDKKVVRADSRLPLVVAHMVPSGHLLEEVTVKRKKGHYSSPITRPWISCSG